MVPPRGLRPRRVARSGAWPPRRDLRRLAASGLGLWPAVARGCLGVWPAVARGPRSRRAASSLGQRGLRLARPGGLVADAIFAAGAANGLSARACSDLWPQSADRRDSAALGAASAASAASTMSGVVCSGARPSTSAPKPAVDPGLSVPSLRLLWPLRGLTSSATCIRRGLVVGAVLMGDEAPRSICCRCGLCSAWRPRPPAANAAWWPARSQGSAQSLRLAQPRRPPRCGLCYLRPALHLAGTASSQHSLCGHWPSGQPSAPAAFR